MKLSDNQASHTTEALADTSTKRSENNMSVSARHFHYEALNINLNRNGTSTEAAIVWI